MSGRRWDNGYAGVKPKGARLITKTPTHTIIKNLGTHHRKVLIGEPTLGIITYFWHVQRMGQIIPVNWTSGSVMATHQPETVCAEGYTVADAQNVICERLILDKYEWLILLEDDTLPPFDTFMKLNTYMEEGKVPIVSGLYFTKGNPSWPLVFRGRGNGAFTHFEMGDKVWADGVPTGLLMVNGSIIDWMWRNSPEYKLPDGRKVRRIFQTPRDSWFDAEADRFFSTMGTSDLEFCGRIMKENVLTKAGWGAFARKHKRLPFLVDTSIFAGHIDINTMLVYPQNAREVLWPTTKTSRVFTGKR